jgi:hypothetical protein
LKKKCHESGSELARGWWLPDKSFWEDQLHQEPQPEKTPFSLSSSPKELKVV